MLKLGRVTRKSLVCALLTLVIITALIVPATSVMAAEQDWPLRLVGATTVDVTQAEFEAMAAANPSNTFTDLDGHTWRGLALWRLIALVDDGDPGTFNDALADAYTIALSAADGYVKVIAPPYEANFEFARSEDVFVANEVMLSGTSEWVPLPMTKPESTKMWYPLRVTGAGCAYSSQMVGGLIEVELQNLPMTVVGVSPASQAVDNGASFTLDLAIDTDTAARGWQADVQFDASKMQCTGVTEGGFLKDWALANGGGTIPAGAATIDNVTGLVSIPGYAITGAGTDGPTGAGVLCTLAFDAASDVNSFADVTLSGVVVSDTGGTAIPGVVTNGGTVAIGDVPMPDLIISTLSAATDGEGTYAISLVVKNVGDDVAAASSISIAINGEEPMLEECPALGPDATYIYEVGCITFTGPTDVIVVTADSAGVVNESNELNNTREIVYAPVGDEGDVIVNGNILAKLHLTVPADILNWVLEQGPNSVSRLANVKCNTPWQLQVNDQDGDTGGFMTKWQADAYDTSVKLANRLQVGSEITVALSGSNQLIADGIVADQNGDAGQDLTVDFSQQVLYSDPVLSDGCTYHIVVTFTASSTL